MYLFSLVSKLTRSIDIIDCEIFQVNASGERQKKSLSAQRGTEMATSPIQPLAADFIK